MSALHREDYRDLLASLNEALELCRESLARCDADHRLLLDNLSDARDRLVILLRAAPPSNNL